MESFRTHPAFMGLRFLFLLPFILAMPAILREASSAHGMVYLSGIVFVLSFIIYGNFKPVVRMLDKGISLTNHYPAYRSYNDLLGYKTVRETVIVLYFRSWRRVRLHLKKEDRKVLILGLKYHDIEVFN